MRLAEAIVGLAPLLALAACAGAGVNAGPPSAPGVVAVPNSGKPLPEFQAEDAACRAYAGQQTGGPALPNNGYTPGTTLQQRYDIAYTQCMYSKGNTVLSSRALTGPVRFADYDYEYPFGPYPYYGVAFGSAVFVNGGGHNHFHGPFHHGWGGPPFAYANARGWTGGHGWTGGGRGWAGGHGPGGHGPGGGGAIAAGGPAGGGHGGGRG